MVACTDYKTDILSNVDEKNVESNLLRRRRLFLSSLNRRRWRRRRKIALFA